MPTPPLAADPLAALADAIRADDVDGATALLARHPSLAARLDEPLPGGAFGERPLGAAVGRGSRAMIDLLLRHGADVNGRSDWWAGGFGVLDTCEPALAPFLIERGATVDAHAAARLGMLDRLATLLDADPSLVRARGGDGQTPLHFARDVATARLLLDRGADPDARDVDHESTPAQWMVRDRPDVARLLVERGGRTDVLLAAALGDADRVRRHLDADPAAIATRVTDAWFPKRDPRAGGTIYHWTIGRNRTAHMVAHAAGHADVLALLMERSPEPLRFAQAAAVGDAALAASLLAAHPALARELPDAERRMLADAARDEDLATLRRLLDAGWPLDARGDEGATALHWGAWLGNAAIVRDLLRHGPPLEARDRAHGGTPLGWALHGSRHGWRSKTGDFAGVVEALLAAGAEAPALTPAPDGSEAALGVLRRHAERAG